MKEELKLLIGLCGGIIPIGWILGIVFHPFVGFIFQIGGTFLLFVKRLKDYETK